MIKKMGLVLFSIVLLSGINVYAQQDDAMMDDSHMGMEKEGMPVEVGNTLCPVSGEKVGEMAPAVKVEYKGKIYNLCCKMCKADFMRNPEKYSKIAEDEAASMKKDHNMMMEEGH